MPIVIDADARERALTAPGHVLVEAGAGTGKTTLLISRVVEGLVRQGIPLSRMLLITFMDKAHEEMRARLFERLTELKAGARSEEEAQRLDAWLDALPAAEITTIHGFCHRLLSEFGVDYGIPPNFRVLDAIEAERLWSEAFRRWSQTSSRQAEILGLLHAGIAWPQLVRWARQISGWPTVPSYEGATPDLRAFVEKYGGEAEELAWRASQGGDPEDAGVRQIGDVARRFRWLKKMPERDWPRILAQWTQGLSPRGNQRRWREPAWLVEQKAWLRALKDELDRLRTAMADSYLATWLALVRDEFLPYWRAFRFDALSLTYDDLLWEAERITRAEAVWAQISRRYDLVMVDEFQDTDPVQTAIIRRLVTPVGAARLEPGGPGRLFLVGDPKQSIYRFRGADVETYAAMREEIQSTGGDVIAIVQNFRSHPAILDFVNRLFAQRWPPAPDAARPYIPPFAPLAAAFPSDARCRVAVRIEGEGLPARQKRQAEAESVAAVVEQAVREAWPVRTGGGVRPIGYGDIALLVPQRTELAIYRDALAARNIPADSQSEGGFFRTDEIRGLRHLYCALANPADSGSVVGWLLSPWVAMTHEMLAEHRARGGHWDYRAASSGHPDVLAWFARLKSWHERAWRVDPETVLDWAWEASALPSVLRAREDAQALANLRYLRMLCRDLGDRWGFDLFLDWFDRQVTEEARFEEAPVPRRDNAVLISTVHQAKGLEWPMVIVANWTLSRRSLESGIHYNPRLNRVALRQDPWMSRDWAQLEEDHVAREAAEGDRLLYVALTRARDYLWFYASFVAEDIGVGAHSPSEAQ
ncbi:MAG: UvrD-helicase domain-containing protein [Firmicutes bacterium]|nr:UvrD-helicase domain-containing protein [Bacillota bacterium]